MKKLIVTADDFGLSLAVNQAVEQAFNEGILTTTSLMAGAAQVQDAIDRARRNPGLRIGLHVVVARGRPVLPADEIPDLVDANGRFMENLFLSGVRIFFLPGVKRQLEREIEAQFKAFHEFGLTLDHVNAHNHMHLHPTVFGLILKVGRKYGLRSLRIPYEPLLPIWRAGGESILQRIFMTLFLGPWVKLLHWRASRAGLNCNDYIFGLFDTGRMETERVLKLLSCLPEGVSELYFHPAVADLPGDRPLRAASCATEYETLLSGKVRNLLQSLKINLISFSDIVLEQS